MNKKKSEIKKENEKSGGQIVSELLDEMFKSIGWKTRRGNKTGVVITTSSKPCSPSKKK